MLTIEAKYVGQANERPWTKAKFAESHLQDSDLTAGIPYATREERKAAIRETHRMLSMGGMAVQGEHLIEDPLDTYMVVNAVTKWRDRRRGIPHSGTITSLSRADWNWALQMKEDARKMQRTRHVYERRD